MEAEGSMKSRGGLGADLRASTRIAGNDLRDAWRDGRFFSTLLLALLLLGLSLGATVHAYKSVQEQRTAAMAETHSQFISQTPKNPHAAAHYGMFVFQPNFLTSLIDPGIQAYTGVAIFLEPHRQNDFLFRPADDAGASARFGSLSASIVLQVFVPLLIIVLTFDAVAGEQINGTLRQLLASGLSLRGFGVGKLLGSVLKLLLLALPVLLACAFALWSADVRQFAGSGPRFAWMVAAYGFYFLIWLFVTLIVSVWSQTPRTSLAVSLGIWVIATLLLPRLAVDLSRTVYRTPSNLEMEQVISKELAPDPAFEAKLRRDALAQYRVTRVEDLPVTWAGISLMAAEARSTRVYDRHMDEVHRAFTRQDKLQAALGLLDPTLAVRAVSMGFAGTNESQQRAFAQAAEHYRQTFVTMMNGDLAAHGRKDGSPYVAGHELFERVGAFSYQAPSAGQVLAQQWSSLAALLLGAGVSLSIFLRSLPKLRPTR